MMTNYKIYKYQSNNQYEAKPKAGKAFRCLAFMLAVLASLVVTIALLLLMHSLIYQEYVEPAPVPTSVIAKIWAEEPVIETHKKTKKPKRQEIEEVPQKVQQRIELPEFSKNTGLLPNVLSVDPIKHEGVHVGQSGMLVKRVAASPRYPGSALRRGIEGFVDVKFDVTKIGNTENVRVVQAKPEGVFEKSAVQAVLKYKYQPALQDGEPQATANVMERIRFSIEQ